MNAEARAGDYAGNANLESIARYLCGENVIIQWLSADRWLGLATRNADGEALIFLNPAAPAERLGFVLAHECGHLALGHCRAPAAAQTAEQLIEFDEAAILERLTAPESQAWGEVIDKREAEANAFAADALAAFERKFGQFLEAI